MANFNYVAPLVGKSYSEWNRERLTAKQAAEAANLKNQLASQQSQKDMHSKRLKELRGFKPENWSALDVEAFNSEVDYVRNNLAYFDETQWDNALNGLNQLLIFGDQQSELNSYDLQYQEGLQGMWNENDFPDSIPQFNINEYNRATSTFNNVGILDPTSSVDARSGKTVFTGYYLDPEVNDGKTTLKDSITKIHGDKVTFGPPKGDPQNTLLEYAYFPDGSELLVKGDNWRSPYRGSLVTYSVTRNPLEPINVPTFASKWSPTGGSSLITGTYNRLMDAVNNQGKSPNEARQDLMNITLRYADPTRTGADKQITAAAVALWEEYYEDSWSDDLMEVDPTTKSTPLDDAQQKTPWMLFAEETANLFDFEKDISTQKPTQGVQNANADYTNLLNSAFSVEGAMDEWVTAVNDPKYNWSGEADLNTDKQFMLDKGAFGGDLGQGVHITTAAKDLTFNGKKVSKFTIYPDDNYATLWLVNPAEGDAGTVGAGSPHSYRSSGFGEPAEQPWIEIELRGGGGQLTNDYHQLIKEFDDAYDAGTGSVPNKLLLEILRQKLQ